MNLPKMNPVKERARDAVAFALKKAHANLGVKLSLHGVSSVRTGLTGLEAKVPLTGLGHPLVCTSEHLIAEAIEKKWRLTPTFMYSIKYKGGSVDECSQYFYYEVIFSQPTAAYPIPQATVSVFFRVEQKLIEKPEERGVPMMMYTLEGQRAEHDVRYITLTKDWILALLQMKIKLFKRVEGLNIF